MIDYKSIATSIADGLNGIARATRSISTAKTTPEIDRWTREMGEASKHVLMAFGIDPAQLNSPAIPCGGGWFVEWREGESGEWVATQK
jgi:hypothetical protein